MSKFDNGFFVNNDGELFEVINGSPYQLTPPPVELQPGFYKQLTAEPVSLDEVEKDRESVGE